MDQLSVTSILTLFDTNKEQRKTFVQSVIDQLGAGQEDPLKVHVQVKCMEDILKNLLESKEYKSLVMDQALKYGSTKFDFHNAQISIKEAGVKYDYMLCNDPVYADLLDTYKHAEKLLKEREKFLRAIPDGGMDMLLEGGEVKKVFAPVKTSTTTTVVTLK